MTTERKRSRLRRWLLMYPSLTLVAVTLGSFIYVMTTRYPQQSAPAGPQALVGATVLHGPELEPHADSTVLVQDGIIQQVGEPSDVEIPDAATVIDLQGRTLLPGLIDMHVHLGTPGTGARSELQIVARSIIDGVRHAPDQRRAMLEHGVTSFRSLGDDPAWILELRELVADGTLEGPRVFAAGPLFTSPGGHPVQTLHGGDVVDGVEVPATPEEARRAAAHLAADLDVDVIKVVHDRGLAGVQRLEPLSPEILDAIAEEADRHGLPVVAHWGDQTDLEELLDAGVDGLEHFHPRGRMLNGSPPDSLHALSESGVHLGPTVAVMDAVRDEWFAEAWEQVQARFRELHSSGVPIIAGSDAPMNGLRFGSGLQRELELLVEF